MKDKYVYELTLDEALLQLDHTLYDRNCDIRVIKARQQLIDVIRNKTNKLKKDLEVLDILKNKQVNIHFDLVVKDTYEEYLAGVEGSKEYLILTEEERNELKEWLNNGK